MVRNCGLVLIVALLMAGCARQTLIEPVAIDHPANPKAREAPYQGPSQTLGQEPQDATRTTAPGPGGHGEHGRAIHQPDHLSAPETTRPQTAPDSDTFHRCPMHPDVVQKKAGNCPQCGMKLVRKKEAPQ